MLTAAAAGYPEAEMAEALGVLGAQFAELVDQLLGWSLDMTAPAALCAEFDTAICEFGHLWGSSAEFGLTIARHLVDDLEALPPEPLPPMPPPPPKGAMPPPLQIAPQLARFVGSFSAVVGGMGRRFVAATDHASLVGRCMNCLAARLPAALQAAQPPTTSASDLSAFASACVMRLATALGEEMAPHHAAAARVLLAPLHTLDVTDAPTYTDGCGARTGATPTRCANTCG